MRGLPNPSNPVGGLDGFCSIIETTAAVVVALTGGMLVAVLALLSPIGLPVHSPGVFGVDRNASRCSRLASSRSSRCRPRTSAGVASGAGEQLAEERLHEDGEGARAASAGDRAPARAAAASEIGRPVEGYGDLPSTATTANNDSGDDTRRAGWNREAGKCGPAETPGSADGKGFHPSTLGYDFAVCRHRAARPV